MSTPQRDDHEDSFHLNESTYFLLDDGHVHVFQTDDQGNLMDVVLSIEELVHMATAR